jgi:hypothetical protein
MPLWVYLLPLCVLPLFDNLSLISFSIISFLFYLLCFYNY